MNPPDDLLDRLKAAILKVELPLCHSFRTRYDVIAKRWQTEGFAWPTDALLLVEQPEIVPSAEEYIEPRVSTIVQHIGCTLEDWTDFIIGYDGFKGYKLTNLWAGLGRELHEWSIQEGLCRH